MTTQSTASAARHFLSQFRALIKFAEEIEAFGANEAEIVALKAEVPKARGELAAIKAEITVANGELAASNAEVIKAQKRTKDEEAAAKAIAASIITAAKAEIIDLKSAAQATADKAAKEAQAAVIKAGQQVSELEKEITGLEKKRDTISLELSKLQKKFA